MSTPPDTGPCMDLPLPVFDKYFQTAARDSFTQHTAATICGGCPFTVRWDCLHAAVTDPGIMESTRSQTRGGMSGQQIRRLRRQYFLSGVPSDQLVDAQFRHIEVERTVGDFRHLREGQFADAQVLS